MNLCSDGHGEVCHEDFFCPACELREKLADAEDQINSLEKNVDVLQGKLEEMKAQAGARPQKESNE